MGLPEIIGAYAADPERVALITPGATPERFTYRDLWELSGSCAGRLHARGVRPGDRVALGMASRWEVVVAVIALQRLGCTLIPLHDVPALPPGETRHAAVPGALRAGRAAWCVVAATSVASYEAALDVPVLPLEEIAAPGGDAAPPAALHPDDLVLIQFSSGSTAEPKGVCLTRASVNSHLAAIRERLRGSSAEVTVSWLPLYHDMGLIGALFTSLWAGATLVLLRPHDFVRNPLTWIDAISRYRGTITMGPQFAYSLCATRSRGAAAWERLRGADLSSLRVALNGSETVHWELSTAFAERFAELGLRPNVLQPAYGLAENCVAVTMRDPESPVATRRLSRAALAEGRVALATDDGDARVTVGNGFPVRGTRVAIRDGEGRELDEGEVGEIHIAGSSATAAYCGADGELRPAGAGGWVPTGDVGGMLDGELYVIGRVKEILKCGGRTFVPSDIEVALAARLGDGVGGVAAFGFYDAESGGEQLVVVAETPKGLRDEERDELPGRIRLCVLSEFQLPVREVVLIRARSIPRTSSGKIQRVSLQAAYSRGRLPELVGA
jgi:acyl-CoA synthetase (AMP-forming)/AMP-acid ligase II